jgi:hypothetical protein
MNADSSNLNIYTIKIYYILLLKIHTICSKDKYHKFTC